MKHLAKIVLGALLGLALTSGASAQPSQSVVPAGYTSNFATVDGLRLHYVRGGQGDPLVLLHGFGSTWYEWRKVMPELAERYTVIAPDLPGLGDSEVPAGGFDKRTTAGSIHGLLQQLGLDQIYLVGHDIGLMVAFAYAAEYPKEVRRLVLLEAPIPDEAIYSFPALTPAGQGAWQFGFFSIPGLPEGLIEGREKYFLTQFIRGNAFNQQAFAEADFEEYARSYRDPDKLHASMEYFRAFPEDVTQVARYDEALLSMPVLALGAEYSLGGFLLEQAQRYASNVRGGVVPDSGHWVPEEQPDYLVKQLLTFFTEDDR